MKYAEAVEIKPEVICAGIWVKNDCVTYEQLQVAACFPGDALDPISGVCTGSDGRTYIPYKTSEEACVAYGGKWQENRCVMPVELIEEIIKIQKEKIVTLVGDPAEKEDIEEGIAPVPVEQTAGILNYVLTSAVAIILIAFLSLIVFKKRRG